MSYTYEQVRYKFERSLVRGLSHNQERGHGPSASEIRFQANKAIATIYPTLTASGLDFASYENIKFEFEQDFIEGYYQAPDWGVNRTVYLTRAKSYAAHLLSILYPSLSPASPSVPTGPVDMTTDFALETSLGNQPGYASVNKFGQAVDCDNGTPTDIWDGANGTLSTDIHAPPTAARIHNIASSNINDTAAGSGARTVRIYYLPDWDTKESSEDITLNGTSNVPMIASAVFIHRILVLTWGISGVNTGDITATAVTDATISAAILTGNNQTQMCLYGIPSTQKLRITDALTEILRTAGGSATASGRLLVMTDPATNVVNNTAWTNKENFTIDEAIGVWEHKYKVPKKVDGPAIIKIQITTDTNNTQATGGFDAYLVDN